MSANSSHLAGTRIPTHPGNGENRRLATTSLAVGFSGTPIFVIDEFSLAPGEVVTLVGPSGVGKTTLFRTLSCELPPISGTFSIDGKSYGIGLDRNFVARNVQGHPLFHWLTVRENLELAAKIRGVPLLDTKNVLAEFSAEHIADRYPNTLSGGERCRASLSHSLLGNPLLLLLDEPFVGLDPVVKQAVARNIFQVARSRRASVLLVSHDLADAVYFSDRILVVGRDHPARIVDEVVTSASDALERVRHSLGAEL